MRCRKMDFIKAQQPRPPRSSTSRSISSSSDDGDTEASRLNEPFGLVSNTFKDLYDYIALESSNPGLFMGSDASLFNIANDTFLEINANLGSGSLSAANGTALSLLQTNVTAGVVSLAAAAAAAATIASVNGTTGSATDVQAKGLQDTLAGSDTEDDFSDVIITTVTSIILGLMILITVIGKLPCGRSLASVRICLCQSPVRNHSSLAS